MLSLKCIRLITCAEKQSKETEATTEQKVATGSYQTIQPQLREASESTATLQEEPIQLQMTKS